MFCRLLTRRPIDHLGKRTLRHFRGPSGSFGYHSSTVPDDAREFDEMLTKLKPMLQHFIEEAQYGGKDFKTLVPKNMNDVCSSLSVDKLHPLSSSHDRMDLTNHRNGYNMNGERNGYTKKEQQYAPPMSMDELLFEMKSILENSAKTMRPQYMDKLSTGSDVIGQMTMLLLGVINNNVHTFRTSTALTAIEQNVIRALCELYFGEEGSKNADGAFVPGGTYTVFKALRIARDVAFPEVLSHGFSTLKAKPIVIASEQMHYSVTLGAQNIGIGADGVVKVKTKLDGTMDIDDLHKVVKELKSNGNMAPFLVSCLAGTTVFGGFDKFHEIAEICRKNNMLMHVDGCWGGMAKFSKDTFTYGLMEGTELADFIGFDAHKMMGVPLISSAFLVKNREHLIKSCSPIGADYIFHKELADSPDIGPRTLQCGRHGDALKVYLSWLYYGREGLSQRVDHCIANARFLYDTLISDDRYSTDFVAVHPTTMPPMFANIAFWYVGKHSGCQEYRKDIIDWRNSGYKSDFKPKIAPSFENMKLAMTKATIDTNNAMKEDGVYAVDYSPMPQLGLPHFFRAVTGNYRMTEETLIGLLDTIKSTATKLAIGADRKPIRAGREPRHPLKKQSKQVVQA